jgi:hypothetical protein
LVSQARVKKITRASRSKLLELERKFSIILNQFVNKNLTPKMEEIPADSLRRRYENEVKVKIRAMTEEAYQEGNQQVAGEIRRIVPTFSLFTSRTDIANIEQKANELNEQFWNTITWIVKRRNEFIVTQATKTKEAELMRKPQYDQQAALVGLASGIAISSFNKAIKSKTEIVKSITPEVPLVTQTTRTPTGANRPGRIVTFARLEGRVMFLTKEDPDVDPKICLPLNRTVYDLGEPGIPEPPLHKHCRCQLVPLIDELAQTDANSLLL